MSSTDGSSPRPATPGELVGMGVVRDWLGVRASRAHTISRDRSFPEPWYVGEKERLWLRAEVVAWFDQYRPERAAELDEAEPGWRTGRRG